MYDSKYKSSCQNRKLATSENLKTMPRFKNPIIQDTKTYLVTAPTGDPLEELPNTYRQKLLRKANSKVAEKYFAKPFDDQAYYREEVKRWKSQTALDFGMFPHENLTDIEILPYITRLPENSDISMTSYGSHYKHPGFYNSTVYANRTESLKIPPSISLGIKHFCPKPGVSEYKEKLCDDWEFWLQHKRKNMADQNQLTARKPKIEVLVHTEVELL